MRQQVEQRTGGKVEQHLVDGGYLRTEDIVQAHQQGVELFVPSKPARNPQNRGRELEPKPSDSEAVQAWKRRMASKEGQEIYKQRAATTERTRISCHAAPDTVACAPFSKEEAHEVRQRHEVLQEIRGSRGICSSADLSWKCFSTALSLQLLSRPALATATYATFRRERRMMFASATKFHRKLGELSGGIRVGINVC